MAGSVDGRGSLAKHNCLFVCLVNTKILQERQSTLINIVFLFFVCLFVCFEMHELYQPRISLYINLNTSSRAIATKISAENKSTVETIWFPSRRGLSDLLTKGYFDKLFSHLPASAERLWYTITEIKVSLLRRNRVKAFLMRLNRGNVVKRLLGHLPLGSQVDSTYNI